MGRWIRARVHMPPPPPLARSLARSLASAAAGIRGPRGAGLSAPGRGAGEHWAGPARPGLRRRAGRNRDPPRPPYNTLTDFRPTGPPAPITPAPCSPQVSSPVADPADGAAAGTVASRVVGVSAVAAGRAAVAAGGPPGWCVMRRRAGADGRAGAGWCGGRDEAVEGGRLLVLAGGGLRQARHPSPPPLPPTTPSPHPS